jgi:CHASE3 domain sensor protein
MLVTQNDAETASRGNTITGDDSYLEPNRTAGGAIGDFVQNLRKRTAEDLYQEVRLGTLDPLVVERLEILRQVNIAIARDNNAFELAQ